MRAFKTRIKKPFVGGAATYEGVVARADPSKLVLGVSSPECQRLFFRLTKLYHSELADVIRVCGVAKDLTRQSRDARAALRLLL